MRRPEAVGADSTSRTTSLLSLWKARSRRVQQPQQGTPPTVVSTPALRTRLDTRTRLTQAPRHDSSRDNSLGSSNSTPATTARTTASTSLTLSDRLPAIGVGTSVRMSDASIHSSPTQGARRRDDHHGHRPLLPHFGRSDETPPGRIKYARNGSTSSPTRRRRGSRHIAEHQDYADEADDEQVSPEERTKKRDPDDEFASPGRAHRLKRLIRKGSKFNLRAAAAGEVISSPSQELYVSPIAGLEVAPSTPSREMPTSSYFAPLSFSTTCTSATTPPITYSPELRPPPMSRSGSYGVAVPLSAELDRAAKAARVLGEEVKATGKAARVLGIESNPPPSLKCVPEPRWRPSSCSSDSDVISPADRSSPTSARRPSQPSPPSSMRSLQITSPTAKASPATPTPQRHRRKRSLSGPSAFASLELPLTTPEISSSSDEDVGENRLLPTMAAGSSRASVSRTTAVPTIGLVTPPPSPPSVPRLSSALWTEDELQPVSAPAARDRSRSKVASVATTYALSVYQDSDDAVERKRHRLTMDSIRFSSAFEGVTGFSTSSGNGSQSRNSLAVPASNGRGPSTRNSARLSQPLELMIRSRSASTMPAFRADSSSALHRPQSDSGKSRCASADWSTQVVSPDVPLPGRRPSSVSPDVSQEGTPQSGSVAPQPRRTNTLQSVASVRTRTTQRSNALAALEGHPCPPPPGALSRPPQDRSSYLSIARGEPTQPPPRACLPPLPSGLTVPVTLPQSLRMEGGRRVLHNSASFLDFDLSSNDDDDDSDEVEDTRWRRAPAASSRAAASQGRRQRADVPDEVSVLSSRFSSLPLRQLELPLRQLAARNGGGSSSRILQDEELVIARSRSSPLLRLDASSSTRQPRSEGRSVEGCHEELRDPYPLSSILSLSSEDDEDASEDFDEDLTSAFPRPPGT